MNLPNNYCCIYTIYINIMIITLVQALIFVAYVTFLMVKFKGPLPSISQSWYRLKYPVRILFNVFCLSLGLLMTFHEQSVLFFLSGVGLSAVGIASWSMSKEKLTVWIHFAGAIIGMLLALLGIGFGLGNWVPLSIWALGSIFMLLFKIKDNYWWIEILAFVTIIIGLLNL